MKKLTATIFVALLTAVSTGAAKADIASSGYVDEKVGAVSATVATKADQSAVDTLSGKVTANEGNITTLQSQMAGKANSADVYTKTDSDGKFQTLGNISDSANAVVNDKDSEQKYPSVKAAHAIATAAVDGVTGNVSGLTTRVDAIEGEMETYGNIVTTNKEDYATAAQGTLADTALQKEGVLTQGNLLTTDAAGKIIDAGAKGALANKNTVSAAEIDANAVTTEKIVDANVTRAKLATDVTTSLDKADNALQSADLAGYVTKEQADLDYAAKSTEQTASTASTNAQQALNDIGTKANLTTTAKDNLVNAINEVDAALDTKADTTAISDMLTKTEAASTYETQENAEATYETKTNAALKYIPKPGVNCTEAGAKCVLVTNGTDFTWEDIARGSSEGAQP